MKFKPLAIGAVVGAAGMLTGILVASNASPTASNAGGQPAVATTVDNSGGGKIVFPHCFDNQIVVDPTIVYTGADPSCDTNPTSIPASSTTTAAPATTSTTAPPSTSTTTSPSASSTTSSPASSSTSSTTPASSTSTTIPASTGCGLSQPAFCETFDQPRNGGTQTGDLDPVIWGVSRIGDQWPGNNNNGIAVPHNACAGGAPTPPPADVQICNGQMVEAVNDGGGVDNLDTYPKQPFNFQGRTGTVVFDVSADSDGTHAAWPEFLITDKPVPGARREISLQPVPKAANEIGFSIDGCNGGNGTTSGVGVIFGSINNVYFDQQGARPNCITKGSSAAMNHFKVEVSTTHIRVSATDAGGGPWKILADEDIPTLNFTQGLVWLNDSHYNARKAVEPCECGDQYDHSFVWDNLGFDGPKTYRDWGFDVPLAQAPGVDRGHGDTFRSQGYLLGNNVPRTLTTAAVSKGAATGALVVFNVYSYDDANPSVSVNGNIPVVPVFDGNGLFPYDGDFGFSVRAVALVVPIGQVINGANTLTFTGSGTTIVSNASIVLVAAAPVP